MNQCQGQTQKRWSRGDGMGYGIILVDYFEKNRYYFNEKLSKRIQFNFTGTTPV